MTRSAGHEEVDDRLRLARKMRLLRRHRVDGRRRAARGFAKPRCKRHGAETHGAIAKEPATSQRLPCAGQITAFCHTRTSMTNPTSQAIMPITGPTMKMCKCKHNDLVTFNHVDQS